MTALPPAASPPDLARLAQDLRLACMRVSRRVRFESSSEIAPHQFSVLARLRAEPAPLGDLAEREQVRAPSMSRTVASLVDLDLLQRSADPADGRVSVISLTARGHDVLRHERAQRDAWMASRLEGLSVADQEILAAATVLLERVVDQ